ncbi:MAG TPA: DUF5615 family PIN-like protein [Chloroflexia bacterium]|jgi:hypothetical protein
MISLLADENLRSAIVNGLLRRNPAMDITRVQDVGLSGKADNHVLEWAAEHNRILVTHDINTIPAEAYSRVRENLPMPGIFVIPSLISVGEAIEQIVLLEVCSSAGEWEGQVVFLPI